MTLLKISEQMESFCFNAPIRSNGGRDNDNAKKMLFSSLDGLYPSKFINPFLDVS
jgi:hypothetical protein